MDILLSDYFYLKNSSMALIESIHNCKSGDTIHLCGGKIDIDNMYAVPQTYYLPRYSNRKKYYAVYLENINDVTIDGDGATLVIAGDISPFGFKNCKNVTIKNLKIDYKTPYFVQGLIKQANDNYIDVEYDSKEYICKYDNKSRKLFAFSKKSDFRLDISSCLTNEFETNPPRPLSSTPDYFLCTDEAHPVYGNMSILMDTVELGNNMFRFIFRNKSVTHNVGNYIVQTDHERRNTNFHFLQCENICMENIDMFSSASFGVVALMCKNINIKNVNSIIKPNSGRMLAVNADVIHLVNTSGKVKITDCIMENNMDDSLNIHSLFSVVGTIINKNTMLVDFTYLAKKALNIYKTGEKINVLNRNTFEKYKSITVSKSEPFGEYHLRIEFCEDISEIAPGDLLESEDAKPEVYLNNCKVGNNRGRGFLVSAGRKTIVENCVFYNMGIGICANGASTSYLEGSAVNELTVRYNKFDDCARDVRAFLISIKPTGIDDKRISSYHKNIAVYDNEFIHNGKRFINIDLASEVLIKNNTYSCDSTLPLHEDINESGICLERCTGTDICDGIKCKL